MSFGFGDLSFCAENFGVKIQLFFNLYKSVERTLDWRPTLMPGQERFSERGKVYYIDKSSIFTSSVYL